MGVQCLRDLMSADNLFVDTAKFRDESTYEYDKNFTFSYFCIGVSIRGSCIYTQQKKRALSSLE